MRRNYEEIYMYNGDDLLGLARIYKYISNLNELEYTWIWKIIK